MSAKRSAELLHAGEKPSKSSPLLLTDPKPSPQSSTTTAMPMPPKTFATSQSSVLQRVAAFLPQIAVANDQLMTAMKTEEGRKQHCIDVVEVTDEPRSDSEVHYSEHSDDEEEDNDDEEEDDHDDPDAPKLIEMNLALGVLEAYPVVDEANLKLPGADAEKKLVHEMDQST